MNCQEAILRLPWWLNGSLEPEERREVKDHLAGCAPCRAALQETRFAWEVYGQHIPIDALVAYADQGGEGIDRGLLGRHLADCPECADELAMIRSSRLLSEHGDVPLLTPRSGVPTPRRRERGWQAAALAAGLTGIVAIGGWVGSVHQLHRMEKVAQAPAGNAAHAARPFGVSPVLAQLSADAVVRDAGAGSAGQTPQTLRLPASGEVTLLLNSPADTPGEHAYKLLDAAGKELASGSLAPSPFQAYFVTVDARRLPPGRYTIQLYVPAATPASTQSFLFLVP